MATSNFAKIIFIFWLHSIFYSCALGNLRPLSSALQGKVSRLGESPEDASNEIKRLRLWANQEPHLKSRSEDQFLVSFLRNAKYDFDAAKEKLDAYYSVRSAAPDVFKNRNIFKNSKLRHLIRTSVWLTMPPNNESTPAVGIARFGAYDPKKFDFDDFAYTASVGYDIAAWENDNAVVSGLVLILDCENVTEAHMTQWKLNLFQKYTAINVGTVPIEVKAFHFINTTPAMKIAVNYLKNSVDKILRERIYDHGSDLQLVYEFVPKHQLPVEYGGLEITVKELTQYMEHLVEKYADYFDEDEKKFGTNEFLRKGISPIVKLAKNIVS